MNRSIEKILNNTCRGGYVEGIRLCRRALEGDRPMVLITPNAEMLSRAAKSSELSNLLRSGDVLFPDGIGIQLAMKRIGLRCTEKSCGIELCTRLFNNLATQKSPTRVFLLGGSPGIADKAAKKLSATYTGICICGTHHGYFDIHGNANSEITALINESRAELLLVCMGFPRQEKWMFDNRHRLPSVRLMMGLGGSLDVWSGSIPRAPKAVRNMGLEWAYRAIKDPSRIARLPYLAEFAAELALPKSIKRR